jgi:hypothetical protein
MECLRAIVTPGALWNSQVCAAKSGWRSHLDLAKLWQLCAAGKLVRHIQRIANEEAVDRAAKS